MWLAFPVTLGLSNADFAPFLKIMVTTKGVACCRSVLHRVLQGAITLLVLFRSSCCGTGRVHPPYACPAVCTRPICQMTFTKPHLKDPSKLCSKGPFESSFESPVGRRSLRYPFVPPALASFRRATALRAVVRGCRPRLLRFRPRAATRLSSLQPVGQRIPRSPTSPPGSLPKLYLHIKTPILQCSDFKGKM